MKTASVSTSIWIMVIITLILCIAFQLKTCDQRKKESYQLTFQKSKNVAEVVNESIATAMISNSTQCGQSASSQQVINIGNIHLGKHCSLNIDVVKQESAMMPNMDCMSKSKINVDMINKIKEQLTQALEQKKKGIEIGLSSQDAENYSSNINKVVTGINIEDTLTCVLDTTQQQVIDIGKGGITIEDCDNQPVNIKNVTQSIVQKGVAKCLKMTDEAAKALNDLDVKIDQSAKQTSIGLDITGILGMILGIVVVLVFGGLIVKLAAGGGGKSQPPASN